MHGVNIATQNPTDPGQADRLLGLILDGLRAGRVGAGPAVRDCGSATRTNCRWLSAWPVGPSSPSAGVDSGVTDLAWSKLSVCCMFGCAMAAKGTLAWPEKGKGGGLFFYRTHNRGKTKDEAPAPMNGSIRGLLAIPGQLGRTAAFSSRRVVREPRACSGICHGVSDMSC